MGEVGERRVIEPEKRLEKRRKNSKDNESRAGQTKTEREGETDREYVCMCDRTPTCRSTITVVYMTSGCRGFIQSSSLRCT